MDFQLDGAEQWGNLPFFFAGVIEWTGKIRTESGASDTGGASEISARRR